MGRADFPAGQPAASDVALSKRSAATAPHLFSSPRTPCIQRHTMVGHGRSDRGRALVREAVQRSTASRPSTAEPAQTTRSVLFDFRNSVPAKMHPAHRAVTGSSTPCRSRIMPQQSQHHVRGPLRLSVFMPRPRSTAASRVESAPSARSPGAGGRPPPSASARDRAARPPRRGRARRASSTVTDWLGHGPQEHRHPRRLCRAVSRRAMTAAARSPATSMRRCARRLRVERNHLGHRSPPLCQVRLDWART